MLINFNNFTTVFKPWNPSFGRAFNAGYAFDSETTLIHEKRPWSTPAYVIGAAFDGTSGIFIPREHVGKFFEIHKDLPVCMHNASFDLRVVNQVSMPIDVYELVEQDLVWDTQLLYRLLMLATEGHTANGKDRKSTLEHCVKKYIDCELPKNIVDSDGNQVRLSYGKFLGKPPKDIPEIYLEYLAKDVVATFLLFNQLYGRIDEVISSSQHTWGFVDPTWLASQCQKWGPLTHHIQLKASIVLNEVSGVGLRLDPNQRGNLIFELNEMQVMLKRRLRAHGFLPDGNGSGKALQQIMRRLERQYPELNFPRTPSGKYATSKESLEDLHGVDFIDDFLQYKAIEKLLSTFLTKMGVDRVHPSFGVLQRSGRTSSFGEINAQNLPRDDRVRGCFVPTEGHVFINADYSTVEMATLAQSTISQFGSQSAMAHAINNGTDLHRLVASRVTGKPENEVNPEDRQKAKPINFGKPAGMGDAGLRRYAKSGYGVELTEVEVTTLTRSWFQLFPEMSEYLSQESCPGLNIAKLFDLSPFQHKLWTGSDAFSRRCTSSNEMYQPNEILGWMFRKTLMSDKPESNSGNPYSQTDLDFFWTKAQEKAELFPAEERMWVESRRPLLQLAETAQRIADLAPCITATGRIRAKAGFCARHNTLFQGLAADGAKLAMWKLWRAGYRIVNFIHDEFLIEVSQSSDLQNHADQIERLMIEGMRLVVPDVAIRVEYVASNRWSKSAKKTVDENGKLVVWCGSVEGSELVPA